MLECAGSTDVLSSLDELNYRIGRHIFPAIQVGQQQQETAMLQKSQPAPDFHSPNQRNQIVSLSDFKGKKHVVLYFYPKDDTPGCTIEANQFTALASEFAALDAVVIGVSKDSCASHQAFIDKYGLNLDLLADADGSLCERYGVWQEKERNGEKKQGIVRSTFLIDKHGILQEALYGVRPDGHAQEMLQRVKQLQSPQD
jgi:peroxiredoxin